MFAVVTIGTAVVLVLSALLGKGGTNEKQFEQGKEILSLLLGVFGTIIGFYFGSHVAVSARRELELSTVDVSPRSVEAGTKVTIRAVASGGVPPYRFNVGLGTDAVKVLEPVGESGWIVKEVTTRPFRPNEPQVVRVVVQDANRQRVEQSTPVDITAPHSPDRGHLETQA